MALVKVNGVLTGPLLRRMLVVRYLVTKGNQFISKTGRKQSNQSMLPICGKGKVGLVCRGWYGGWIKADLLICWLHIPGIDNLLICGQNPKAPIKAVERVKSFSHSRLTEPKVTGNKSNIGGKFLANLFHKGRVPENASLGS